MRRGDPESPTPPRGEDRARSPGGGGADLGAHLCVNRCAPTERGVVFQGGGSVTQLTVLKHHVPPPHLERNHATVARLVRVSFVFCDN